MALFDRCTTLAALHAAALLLAACGGTPLAPAPVATATRVGVPPTSQRPPPSMPPSSPAGLATTPSAPARAPLPPPGAALATPVAPSAAAPLPATAPTIPVPAPLPPAVAARFPEPAVAFQTPAFTPGRTDFTHGDELRDLLARLATRGSGAGRGTDIRAFDIGVSQGGAAIAAISFGRAAGPAPATLPAGAAPAARRPALFFLAGQHGDEPAGTEALLVLAQQLAAGDHERALDAVDIVLVPLANPDGAALFQRGTADGIDLNRDHALLQSPEAQAVAELVREWQPIVVADLHEYPVDGAFARVFAALPRHDVLLQAATVANLHPFVQRAAEEWFRAPLAKSLTAAGYSTEWYHTVADDAADRRVSMGGTHAGIERNAMGLRHAVSLLVETRGGGIGRADLKRRVQAQLLAAQGIVGSAAARAADLVKLRQFVDRDVAAKACQGEAVIESVPTPSEYALQVLDPQTGAARRITVNWESALELRALKSRPRPCGYWLSATQGAAVQRLRLLGIEVQQVDEAGEVRGETYRELSRTLPPAPGAAAAAPADPDVAPRLRVQTQPVLLDVAAGSYYVSLEQPLANLAIAVLEPESPSSWVAWRAIDGLADVSRVLARPQMRMAPQP